VLPCFQRGSDGRRFHARWASTNRLRSRAGAEFWPSRDSVGLEFAAWPIGLHQQPSSRSRQTYSPGTGGEGQRGRNRKDYGRNPRPAEVDVRSLPPEYCASGSFAAAIGASSVVSQAQPENPRITQLFLLHTDLQRRQSVGPALWRSTNQSSPRIRADPLSNKSCNSSQRYSPARNLRRAVPIENAASNPIRRYSRL